MVSQRREVYQETIEPEAEPLHQDHDDEPEEKRTCAQSCMYAFRKVTVEPTVLLFIMGYMIASLATTNLSLQKACRVNLNFSDEICTAMNDQTLDSQNEFEREAQRLLARALSWRTYITATIPCVIGLFVGPWQDKTGRRKIFLVIALMGQVLGCINSMINVYFFYQLNLEVLIFTEALLDALSGGSCVVIITVFSFISTITTEKNRTFRMGLVNFSLTVGLPVGIASSGIMLRSLGFYGPFGFSLGIHLINAMYNAFVLKDPKRTEEQKKHDGQGVRYFFRTFFDLSNIKETIKVVFKNGPKRRRLRMCVLMVIVTFLFGPMFGEMSVMYMSTRYRFNWDEVKYSLFQAYNFITHTIGTVFSITVFSKYLQWHDSMLGIISTVSKIAASFVYCFAPNETIFFIGPMVEILNGTSMLALRSIFSKLVAADEIGKVNSIIGLTETLMPLAYVPLYTQVYTATMEVLPGAVFLLGAAMTLPAVVVFIWLFVEHRRGLRKKPVIENGTEVPLKQM
ncbi:proton-coupled folate transporter-like [Ostrinia nubilalis]|uniref:proton-coupled folate transporter-like n=1 Tax=Ostrinia nubilalis TaxID=29057 RepID=UPI0030825EDA